MLRIAIFELIQLGVSAYAIFRGGSPERIAAAVLLLMAWASLALSLSPLDFDRPVIAVLVLDVMLFGVLTGIALWANRFWPLWAAALQLLAVGTHAARAVDPLLLSIVYSRGVGEIAYPICLALALGTFHFRRRWRLQETRPRDWAPVRW